MYVIPATAFVDSVDWILVIKLKNWDFASPFESWTITVPKLLLYVDIRFYLTETQMRAVVCIYAFIFNDKEV